jgi:hypothetical protein
VATIKSMLPVIIKNMAYWFRIASSIKEINNSKICFYCRHCQTTKCPKITLMYLR